MKIALDLGSQTGYAVVLQSGAKMSGTLDYRPKKHENWSARFDKLRRFLDNLEAIEDVEGVWYEEVRRHNGTDAAHIYGAFLGALTGWCDKRDASCVGVAVGTIKKFATGKGNAGKGAMIAACEDRFGVPPIDDNEADAVCLREYVLSGAL